MVTDRERLAQEGFPKFFKHTKFTSFVRQLNMYGFVRIEPEVNETPKGHLPLPEFFHPLFMRGNYEAALTIQRNPSAPKPPKSKSKSSSNSSNPSSSNPPSSSSSSPSSSSSGVHISFAKNNQANLASFKKRPTINPNLLSETGRLSTKLPPSQLDKLPEMVPPTPTRSNPEYTISDIPLLWSMDPSANGTETSAASSSTASLAAPIIAPPPVLPPQYVTFQSPVLDPNTGKKKAAVPRFMVSPAFLSPMTALGPSSIFRSPALGGIGSTPLVTAISSFSRLMPNHSAHDPPSLTGGAPSASPSSISSTDLSPDARIMELEQLVQRLRAENAGLQNKITSITSTSLKRPHPSSSSSSSSSSTTLAPVSSEPPAKRPRGLNISAAKSTAESMRSLPQ